MMVEPTLLHQADNHPQQPPQSCSSTWKLAIPRNPKPLLLMLLLLALAAHKQTGKENQIIKRSNEPLLLQQMEAV